MMRQRLRGVEHDLRDHVDRQCRPYTAGWIKLMGTHSEGSERRLELAVASPTSALRALTLGDQPIETAESRNGIPIPIPDERWTHIVEAHDYMAGNLELVIETIEDPDEIVAGSKGELIALHHHEITLLAETYVVAVYREFQHDSFLITAFMISRPDTILRKGIL